jgi:hypothetical protein
VVELRPELMPPALDDQLVTRLAELGANLDGDPDEDMRAEFNRLAGTSDKMGGLAWPVARLPPPSVGSARLNSDSRGWGSRKCFARRLRRTLWRSLS